MSTETESCRLLPVRTTDEGFKGEGGVNPILVEQLRYVGDTYHSGLGRTDPEHDRPGRCEVFLGEWTPFQQSSTQSTVSFFT